MATAREAAVIAEACRKFMLAHERRAANENYMTANERSTAWILRDVLNETRMAA